MLAAKAWSVRGYAEHPLRERDFSFAGDTVRGIARSGSAAKLAKRTVEPELPTTRSYRFELASSAGALAGACTEHVAPQPSVFGVGARRLRLHCACSQGAVPRSELTLVDGEGSAQLSDGTRYQVTAVRKSAEGKRERTPLGYLFGGDQSTGALEHTGAGRAWPPTGLDERSAVELRCIYAALFLYRH